MSSLPKVKNNSAVTPFEKMEALLIKGDLSKMNEEERTLYYNALCDSLGLNPLTQPFEYINMQGKTVLYARKSCTEQLRQKHGISVTIVAREKQDDIYLVTARAKDRDGREDESIGVVNIKGLAPSDLANAIMKCETKAKRRVTLSICGLGFTDESELDTIPNAKPVKQLNGNETKKLPWEGNKQTPALADYVIPVGQLKGTKLSQKDKDFWLSYRKEIREKLSEMPDDVKECAIEILKHLDDYLAE